jgi:hypothetical protein
MTVSLTLLTELTIFTDTAISSAAPTRRILFSCRTRSNLA